MFGSVYLLTDLTGYQQLTKEMKGFEYSRRVRLVWKCLTNWQKNIFSLQVIFSNILHAWGRHPAANPPLPLLPDSPLWLKRGPALRSNLIASSHQGLSSNKDLGHCRIISLVPPLWGFFKEQQSGADTPRGANQHTSGVHTPPFASFDESREALAEPGERAASVPFYTADILTVIAGKAQV